MFSPRLLAALLLFFVTGCAATADVATDRRPSPDPTPTEEVVTEAPADEAVEPDEAATAPGDWWHADAEEETYRGVSTRRAYRLLAGRAPQDTVVVAVLDSGVDIAHEDLDDVIWTNPGEVPANGRDDDGNGYVDDVHGWNFIGGPDGRNVGHDSMELTRLVAAYTKRFEGIDPDAVPEADRADYERFQALQADFASRKAHTEGILANIAGALQATQAAEAMLQAELGTDDLTLEAVQAFEASNEQMQRAKDILQYIYGLGLDAEMIAKQQAQVADQLRYGYDLTFDPRDIVGDDYADTSERFYGNNDVTGPDATHGTIVAGIIAAERDNGLGIDGIAAPVRIMVVRTVPDGDERDKDVANAIRYAVDNGASVINMSFGKAYSPQKAAVDAAVRYAQDHDVLLVHAAGNDGKDLDVEDSFPSRRFLDGNTATTWLEVGASSWGDDALFVGNFSNYGQETVDLFAPGVDVRSTAPDQGYQSAQGTSMAAPVVAGVAALVRAYFPEMSAQQVKQVLLDAAWPYAGTQVARPGDGEAIDFAALSITGGIVNAYRALELAAQRAGE